MSIVDSSKLRYFYHSRMLQWLFLGGLSLLLVWAMNYFGIAAGWMLGPMIAGIVSAIIGIRIQIFKSGYQFSQAIVGCLIAQSLTIAIVKEMARDWELFLSIIIAVMILSWGLGWILAKSKVIPGQVAIWGTSPGAASAMVILAKAYGADARLVAFMQYLRVLLVVVMASLAASFAVSGQMAHHGLFAHWLDAPNWLNLFKTLALMSAGVIFANLVRIPAGSMIVPMILGAVLHLQGWLVIDLPQPLLVASYVVIGWVIGLGFDRQTLKVSMHALPRVLLANLILISLCGLLGLLVSHWFHIDMLSAYLATSPGGANTVAIIALSTPVNVPFIMALQTARMLLVILLGPWIAKWLGRHIEVNSPE
ncbi:AbrB family transcriptional regulator [Celerinatantimonas yamalensis]|uniref:AbrB family transcriptional regulator n=1 Tax=Celerinatantimonas yamalensis TaxID=559956 RepID=A0ABW9G2N8_9GAMM